MVKHPKRPGDFAQRAKLIIDIATGAAPPDPPIKPETKFTERARKGGLKGGHARAKKLSARKRTAVAKKAAAARWAKKR